MGANSEKVCVTCGQESMDEAENSDGSLIWCCWNPDCPTCGEAA